MRIQWDLTNACNLHCRHCNTLRRRHAGFNELNTAEAKKVIDNLKASGVVDTILFGGGEVTIRQDFLEIVHYASEHGISVWFTTNGQELSDEMISTLMENNIGAICVSLDGATPETHEWVRGKGSFDRAQECLRKVAEEKRRHGYSTLIQLSFTLMRKNMHEAEAAGHLAASLGAEVLCFLHLVNPYLARFDWKNQSPSPEERLEVSIQLAKMAAELQKPTLLPVPARVIDSLRKAVGYQFIHTSMQERCSAGLHVSFLSANGNLVPCNAIYGSPERAKLYPKESRQLSLLQNDFLKVYFSDTFTNFIKVANDPARTSCFPEICRDCDYRLARQCQPFCLVGNFEDDMPSRTCEVALAQGII